MTELDFTQKLEMRRAFWAMGASTRIDVKLSALVPRATSRTRAGIEEWTDLDVLAVDYSPLAGLALAVADCKTLRGRVTERVFWLRGVADLFEARSAYLTRDETLPASSRQLALRLGIAALDADDRRALVAQAGDRRLPIQGSFLEADTLQRWTALLGETPKAAERLARYRRSSYWIAPRHRNLTYLPTQVRSAAKQLLPAHRWAHATVVDLAWLYLLAVLSAVEDVSRVHLSDPTFGLRLAVVGSEQEVREKQWLAERLATIFRSLPTGPEGVPDVGLLPEYFDGLVALVGRVLRRQSDAAEAMRVLEFVGVETMAGRGVSWEAAFPDGSPYGPKLASDLVHFLARACGLDADFGRSFDDALGGRGRWSPARQGAPSKQREPAERRPSSAAAATQVAAPDAADDSTLNGAGPGTETKRSPEPIQQDGLFDDAPGDAADNSPPARDVPSGAAVRGHEEAAPEAETKEGNESSAKH